MKRKLILFFTVIFILSLAIAGCSSQGEADKEPATGSEESAEEEVIVMVGGTAAAPTMPPNVATKKWIEIVESETNGRIKIDFYEGRQLGDDAEMLEQAMNGTIEFCLTSSSMFSTYTPLLDVLQTPFLLNTYEKLFAAARTPEFKAICDAIEKDFNVKIIGLYENGIRHFSGNKTPINSVSDLKGQKIRVVPSNLILSTFEALGANPTPMAYGEVYSALQMNVIDGAEMNWTSIYSENFYEQLKYVSEIGLFPFPSVIAVNLDFWNTLSAEDQKILEQAADKAMDENLAIMKEIEENAIKVATQSGVQVNQVENVEEFIEAVQPIYEEYAAKDPLMEAFIEMGKTLE
jgi:tripartite ATP-independent transporter DctP family solute receptor